MRNLAHIETIDWISPIEGKDRIVLAGILGWTVIVQKADFAVGDKVVFCEIDSVFPEKPEFEFLRKNNFRIKTMKMAGVLSQGICFPLSMLPLGDYNVGDDVTELMGITQYEPTMDKEPSSVAQTLSKKYPKFLMRMKWFRKLVLPKDRQGGFPDFISKTDETRIQNAPQMLKLPTLWTATEKVDGQSGTFTLCRTHKKGFLRKEKFDFAVCSRNLRIYEEDNSSYWSVAKKYNIKNVLMELLDHFGTDWVAIQGECVAPNVQKNKYKVSEPDLYVFNIITPRGRMDSNSAAKLANTYGLKFVPVLAENMKLSEMTVEDVLAYSNGMSRLGNTLREGIVFRSQNGVNSFEAVSPEFLIKYNA